jgi:hypothetical protein
MQHLDTGTGPFRLHLLKRVAKAFPKDGRQCFEFDHFSHGAFSSLRFLPSWPATRKNVCSMT